MKRNLSLIALLAIALTSSAMASHPATYAEAKTQAAELGKPLLVDFFTDW